MEPQKRVEIPELDMPASFGFTMRGWNFSSAEVSDATARHLMLNPAIELGANICPWNCDFCFTESPNNPAGRKHRLEHELSLDRRLQLIDEVAGLGAKTINFVGAGEPTIDPGFWQLMQRMVERKIVPIIYTEGSLKLKYHDFSHRLFELGATVVLKVNSLSNMEYQDRINRGIDSPSGISKMSYFTERQKALEVLMGLGFNNTEPTRLAFDTIICKENLNEIEEIHRFARLNNIFSMFINYLPSGRTKTGHITAISWKEQLKIFNRLAEIDKEEFGILHRSHFPYSGGVPCTIRGLGLFIKIQGEVFDCPGELVSLGNLKNNSLAALWEKAHSITQEFDGGCYPRQQFWKNMECDINNVKAMG